MSKCVSKFQITIQINTLFQALFDKLVLQRAALGLNCRLDKTMDPSSVDFSMASDRGYLIWLGLEIAAIGQAQDLKVKAFIKKHLDYWTRSYNYRYLVYFF